MVVIFSSNFLNEPVTLEITKCLILNYTSEWTGSIAQVVELVMIFLFLSYDAKVGIFAI